MRLLTELRRRADATPRVAATDAMGGTAGMIDDAAAATNPKAYGRSLEMRGEMLRAIGDVMMKHGKELRGQ